MSPATILPLRPYQRRALDKLREKWKDEANRRLAIVLPTGAGKTVVFSHLSKEILAEAPSKRVLILVHTDELVRQTVKKVQGIAPNLIVGVVKAKENETTADVIVASVQTLKNDRRLSQIRDVEVVIVDECDLAAAPSYVKILTHFGCFRPDGAKAVGFTATLYRTDGRIGTVWQDVAEEIPITWMIRKRFLIPPRGIAVEVPDLDLRNVKSTRADYKDGELGEALADSLAPEKVAEAIVEHASDRKILAFFPTVASSYVFAEAIEAAGIPAEVVHGGMKQSEIDEVLARHKRGTVVVNCMKLTVGYDDPEVDCIVIGRPTKSKRLYVQIVGRGLRVDPARDYDEQDCLLLDVVGANANHDLRSIVDLSEKALDPKKANGRTLTELEDEFDAGEGVEEDAPVFYAGPVEVREFDPLGRADSSKVWIRTEGGTFFVPAGRDAYVFIMEYPAAGQYTVSWCTKNASASLFLCDTHTPDGVPLPERKGTCCRPRDVAITAHNRLPLEQAMVWAEDLAIDLGSDSLNTANKKAPWRTKPASKKTLDLARGLGIEAREGEQAGKVSDRIARIMGTRRIDPLVRKAGGVRR